MTREHKLALIVGFALVLVVGVLISDHLSGARQAEVGVEDGSLRTLAASQEPPVGLGRTLAPPPLEPYAGGLQPEAIVSGTPTAAPDAVSTPIGGDFIAVNEGRGGPSSTVIDDLRRQFSEAFHDLRNGNTPPATTATEIITGAPRGGLESVQPAGGRPELPIRAAGDAAGSADRAYHVRSGDTLWSIAEKHYGDGGLHKKLAEYNRNRLGSGGVLRAGGSILIPARSALTGEAAPPAVRQAAPAKAEERPAKSAARTYVVKSGETLGEIAKAQLGSAKRWREILELNKDALDDGDTVYADMTLKLPAR